MVCTVRAYINIHMRISEILEGINLSELVPNGSKYRYGSINEPDDCVDPTDPTCPGHRAGEEYQNLHPNFPVATTANPSFKNGAGQTLNVQRHIARGGRKPRGGRVRGRSGRYLGYRNTVPTRPVAQRPVNTQQQPLRPPTGR